MGEQAALLAAHAVRSLEEKRLSVFSESLASLAWEAKRARKRGSA